MIIRLGFLILCFLSALSVSAQGGLTWFEASSYDENNSRAYSLDCTIEKDELQGSLRKIEFKPRQFFVYTHPQVRKYMSDEYLMESTAYVNKVGDNKFLIIQYKINSDKAKINYGNLEKGGRIKVDLINKDHVYLENIERSRGKVRKSDKMTTYIGTYAISKDNANMLKKHGIDKITVLWEEGVEEYEVQNVDLVRNQLHHLERMQ